MSFGLEVTGVDAGGEFLVTSTDLDLSHYIVTSVGYGTSAPYYQNSGVKVFINAKHLPGREIVVVSGTSVGLPSGTVAFRQVSIEFIADFSTLSAVNITTSPVSVYYFIVSEARGVPIPSGSAGDYGLQVYKSDGSVSYDSRRLQTSDSFYVTEFYNDLGPSNSYVTTNTNGYVEATTTGVSSDGRNALVWDSGGVSYRSNTWYLGVDEFVGGYTAGSNGRVPPLLVTALR